MKGKAVAWLCEITNKSILNLTESDYNENNLSELLIESSYYDLNLDFTTKISQALPWYVAIFGGIPAAAGAALVTGILDDNINEITKTSYKIKGNNNNLEVLNN